MKEVDIFKIFNKYDDPAGELYLIKKSLLFSEEGLFISVIPQDIQSVACLKDANGNFYAIQITFKRPIIKKKRISKRQDISNSYLRNNYDSTIFFEDENMTFNLEIIDPETCSLIKFDPTLIDVLQNDSYIQISAKNPNETSLEIIQKTIKSILANSHLLLKYKLSNPSEKRLNVEKQSKIGLSNDFFENVCMDEIKKALSEKLYKINNAIADEKSAISFFKISKIALETLMFEMKERSMFFFGKETFTEEDIQSLNLHDIIKNKKYRKISSFLKDLRRMKVYVLRDMASPNLKKQLAHYKDQLEKRKQII